MMLSRWQKTYPLATVLKPRVRFFSEITATNTPQLQPQLYVENNSSQAIYNRRLLDVFQPTFKVPQCSTHQYLDVGCGTGDFTRDGLLPRCLPCRRLVGIDSSSEMVDYARRHSTQCRLDFHQLDIGGDVEAFLSEFGQFDRVYSFFCFHWLVDQSKGLKNIARLLKSSGGCLIASYASHQCIPVWKQLAKMDRWVKYTEQLKKFIPETEGMSDSEMILTMSKWLNDAGLVPSTLETSRSGIFENGTLQEDIGEM
ncbi:juvenile hormone acid O-methyltransferase-like [Amblyomma americanum]